MIEDWWNLLVMSDMYIRWPLWLLYEVLAWQITNKPAVILHYNSRHGARAEEEELQQQLLGQSDSMCFLLGKRKITQQVNETGCTSSSPHCCCNLSIFLLSHLRRAQQKLRKTPTYKMLLVGLWACCYRFFFSFRFLPDSRRTDRFTGFICEDLQLCIGVQHQSIQLAAIR